MNNVRKLNDDYFYVGASDRRLELFENLFPIPRGIAYNSYLLNDEKTVLFDTADKSVSGIFLENISAALNGRQLDYLIINHMEPDHAATIESIIAEYPDVKIVSNAKAVTILKQFFDFEFEPIIIGDGDTFETGRHILKFIMAPMVHWPETMATYDTTDKILFSADAFGMFGAVDGNLFVDEIDFNSDWQDDARRYYANIVGKYGVQVQSLLTKAAGLDIKMICSLHGPVWRNDITWLLDKYDKWSKWDAECDGVLVAYASMYGNTENAACKVAARLADSGKNVRVINICNTDKSYAIAEMFRAKNIVIACPTYNGGIYPAMESLVLDMKALGIRGRRVGIIENGTWAPMAAKHIKAILETMKDIEVTGVLTVKSSLKENQSTQIEEFCNGLKN
jgi:flavorubredoxin